MRTRSLLGMLFALAVFLLSAAPVSGTPLYDDPPGSREFTPELKLPPPEWDAWDPEPDGQPPIEIPGLEPVAMALKQRLSGDFESPPTERSWNLRVPEPGALLLAFAGFGAFIVVRRRRRAQPDRRRAGTRHARPYGRRVIS